MTTNRETEIETRTVESSLAFAIVFEFLLALGLFSLLYLFLDDIAGQLLFDRATQKLGGEAARGFSYIRPMWNFMPVWAAAASVVFLQARAAFESKGGIR
jgi:hypothetical protein